MTGIEPVPSHWECDARPSSYTREERTEGVGPSCLGWKPSASPFGHVRISRNIGGAVGLSPTLHGTGSALGLRLAARPESPRSLRSNGAGAGCGNRTRLGSLTEGGPHLETEPAKIRVTAECVVHGLSTGFDSFIDCCLTIRRFPHKGGESWNRTNNFSVCASCEWQSPSGPEGSRAPYARVCKTRP